MSLESLKHKKDLILFLSLTVVILAQAVWWIILMARLVDEKVDLATLFGADESFVETLHQQEISRQMMVGMEGIFFLVLVLAGAWLIYRSLLKAEELKAHQQNFLMAVTHELKTPLASLQIYLETLRSPKIPEEKKAAIIPRMKQDVQRLEKLVENVIDAGRFERHGYQLKKERVNLTALLERSLQNLRHLPLEKPLEITQDLAPEVVFYGDPKALDRAFNAIFENCLKYHDKEAIVLKVTLKAEARSIRLSIADNGMGLKKSDTSRIFGRFYRVGDELKRSRPGTGLGLYLSREIIREHGGDVSAHSEGLSKGTTFLINLEAEGINEDDTIG
ncbi:MAG: HAMP domain-containing histidine kinase [candidate division Zixibacteria bacterium]|nr:HAMP domain-containing histidine kinase [candidate division Zixibacteria bacterium]